MKTHLFQTCMYFFLLMNTQKTYILKNFTKEFNFSLTSTVFFFIEKVKFKKSINYPKSPKLKANVYIISYMVKYSSVLFFFHIQAMIEIVMLTGTVAATMVSWYPISRTATLLMVPYLAWLCLATSLNYCIWRDNPDPKKDD